MLQPEISQFLKPKKHNQNADANLGEPQKSENIFVQSMKRRLMECNGDFNSNTSAPIQPNALSLDQQQHPPNRECTNEKCVSMHLNTFERIRPSNKISIHGMKLFISAQGETDIINEI